MDSKSIILGMAIGAGVGGGGATLAAAGDAAAKLRELAPDVATHRIDLATADDGSITAAVHQHGVLTTEAKEAGVERPSWVLTATCSPDAMVRALASCAVDESGTPAAFKTQP